MFRKLLGQHKGASPPPLCTVHTPYLTIALLQVFYVNIAVSHNHYIINITLLKPHKRMLHAPSVVRVHSHTDNILCWMRWMNKTFRTNCCLYQTYYVYYYFFAYYVLFNLNVGAEKHVFSKYNAKQSVHYIYEFRSNFP